MAKVFILNSLINQEGAEVLRMTRTLRKFIKRIRIVIVLILYALVWCEADTSEELLAYQEAGASGTGK